MLDGTLVGVGPGKSAGHRLSALFHMVLEARVYIAEYMLDSACDEIIAAYDRTDSQDAPPDFASGPAAPELAAHLLILLDALEYCLNK